MIRVLFAARGGVQSMADRARGLARHMAPDVAAELDFAPRGWVGVFLSTLKAAIRYDCLWLFSQSPVRLAAAWLGRVVFSTPFVVDTGDLLYESVKTEGRHPIYQTIVRAWEWLSVRMASAVVVRGSRHVAILDRAFVPPVEFIPDGVEIAEFSRNGAGANDRARLRAEFGAGEQTTIVGIVSTISWEPHLSLPSPGWDLVECLARLKDRDVMGLVVGDGPGLPELRKLAERRGVAERIRWVARVPASELPALFSAMDIFLHTALNNPMSAVRTTGKLPLLLASGCAAVVSEVGEAARVLKGTGLLLPFDGAPGEYAEQLAQRVRAIISEQGLNRWRETGPEIARREFDYAALGGRAERLVRELVAGPRKA